MLSIPTRVGDSPTRMTLTPHWFSNIVHGLLCVHTKSISRNGDSILRRKAGTISSPDSTVAVDQVLMQSQ